MMASTSHITNGLPDDVLREIFMWGVYGSERYDNPPLVDLFRYGFIYSLSASPLHPVLLGHVCRRWRQLTLSSPLLWSNMNVRPYVTKDLAVFATWLERSGDASLTLDLAPWHSPFGPRVDLFPFLQLAFEHHRRWKQVTLGISQLEKDGMTTFTRSWEDATFHRLESLSISFGDPQLLQHVPWNPLPAVYSSPAFKSLGFGYNTPFAWIQDAPSHKLTSLSLRGPTTVTAPGLFAVLQKCPALEAIDVALEDVESGLEEQLPYLTLLHLRDLVISKSHRLFCLLDRLTTPSLKFLCLCEGFDEDESERYTWDGYTSQNLLTSVAALAERSRFQPRSLSLQHIDNQEEERKLVQLLSLPWFSGLKELMLYHSTISDVTIAALTVAESTNIVPVLQNLWIHYCISSSSMLLTMVQSKSATLRTVDATFRSDLDDDAFPPVPGVDVKLWTPYRHHSSISIEAESATVPPSKSPHRLAAFCLRISSRLRRKWSKLFSKKLLGDASTS